MRCMKLIVFGGVSGALAGVVIVILARFLSLNFSEKQELFSFWAFTSLGLVMATVNAILLKFPSNKE